MCKIGLLSVYNHNYGSILQAYALQTELRNWGNDTEVIIYKKTNLVKQAVRLLYIPLLKTTVKVKWKSIYCKLFQKDIYNNILVSREKAFFDFIREHISFSKVYTGRKELVEGTSNYDCFVLGSDQVWNPMNLGGDFYTMTFIPENKRKIAYAPSFGVSTIPDNQRKKTQNYLKRIDYISVRESDGVKIVKELIDRDVQQVVDPTILVDKTIWDREKGSKRIVNEKYIFCYFISTNAEYRNFAKELSNKTRLKIVALPHIDEFVKADVEFSDINPRGVGPLQFVNLISNAEYVCTDSFHGTVFSVLYERPFFTFNRYNKEGGESTNSRLYSFLKLIHMEDRMYSANANLTNVNLEAPDFSDAKKSLQLLRLQSKKYLEDALMSIRG